MLELDDQLSLHTFCILCLPKDSFDHFFLFLLMRTSGILSCSERIFSETITCVSLLTEDWGWKLHLTWVIGSILKFGKIN